MDIQNKQTEPDLRLAEIYKDFLPERLFDAHMHLYLGEAIPRARGPQGVFHLEKATPRNYMEDMALIFPGVRQIRLNMIPMPDPALNDWNNGLRDKANSHVAQQILLDPEHVGAAYVLMGDSEEKIGEMLDVPGIRALKPYYYAAGKNASGNSAIEDFLPESAWSVANQRRVPIILHMMRSRSLSDPDNFAYINRMTGRYPDAPLVLAHCARGFAAWTAVDQIRHLNDKGNIWFDMSSVCEVGPMMASIIKNAGKRTMWGSDWPVCMNRGRVISLVDDQHWLMDPTGREPRYAHIAAESMLAFYQTAILLDLDSTQLDDIFYGNAAKLFKV